MKKLIVPMLLLAACSDDDFVASSRLDRLRVLALRSDPVAPAPGESTTLTPLVYVPGDAPLTYAWSWCPMKGDAADGYACPIDQAELDAIAVALGLPEPLPPLELGHEPTQDFVNRFPVATLRTLCSEGFQGLKPDCDDGFPVRLSVRVTSPDDETVATTVLQLPLAESWPENQNPAIGALAVLVDGSERPMGEEPTLSLARLVDYPLHIDVDPATAESFVDGEGQPQKERLALSWFAETGKIDEGRTAYIDGRVPFEDMLDNEFRVAPASEDPGGVIRFYVVLRDQRGGVAWTTGRVRVEETP